MKQRKIVNRVADKNRGKILNPAAKCGTPNWPVHVVHSALRNSGGSQYKTGVITSTSANMVRHLKSIAWVAEKLTAFCPCERWYKEDAERALVLRSGTARSRRTISI